MNLDLLVVGTALPEYAARATMPSESSENKIHEDGLAREMGFRGGLVPGVTVYAWMTHPVVVALGPAWLDRGSFSVRFSKPVYFGERVSVHSSVAARSGEAITVQASVLNEAGESCATATMALPRAHPPGGPDLAAYPGAPLPHERPPVSRAILASQTVLGTPDLHLDESTARAFLDRIGESLPLYAAPGAPAHPGLYLDLANKALSRNVRVSPWIHAESHGQHLGRAHVGERLQMRAKVKSLYERKGHEFVELDLLLVAEGARPVASIRHIAIYQLRGAA
jgi:acyl dehydratase